MSSHYSKRRAEQGDENPEAIKASNKPSEIPQPVTVAVVAPASRDASSTQQRPQPPAPGLAFRTVAPRLRNAVLARGFYRILSTWPLTAQFRALTTDDRVASLEYLRWCRDLFLVFERYGASRSCTMIENAEITDSLREDVWHQGHLFEAWHEYQRHLSGDIHFEHPGWLQATPNQSRPEGEAGDIEMRDANNVRGISNPATAAPLAPAPAPEGGVALVESGRAERIRLLSLDGVSDPRNDRTIHDVEFAAVIDLDGLPSAFLPTNNVTSAHATIEGELTLQQQVLRELEGSAQFPPGLPDLF
jgi:hypothetical protein